MKFPSKESIERLRKEYPVGCRVELLKMDDQFAPPIGTKGVVQGVNTLGDIEVFWSNGSSLSVINGVDACRRCDDD